MGRKLIIVPGFMGSDLARVQTIGQPSVVWYNLPYLLSRGPGALQLANDGFSPGPLAGGVQLTPIPALPQWGGWQSLGQRLNSEGWDVDFFGWDWRQTMVESAALLADYLLAKYQSTDFWVLTHSAGALVARLAYPTWKAGTTSNHWQRSLYVAAPQWGSYDACAYLAAPWQGVPLFGILSSGLIGIGGPILASAATMAVQSLLSQIVVTWPCLYELLPSISGIWQGVNPQDPNMYVAGNYAPPNGLVQQQWLDAARVTRTAIDATLTGARPSEKAVLGIGQDTRSALAGTKSFQFPGTFNYSSGDGAVAFVRGDLGAPITVRQYLIAPHQAVLTDTRFLGEVTALLTDPAPPSETEEPIKGRILIPTEPAKYYTIELPIPPARQIRGDP